MGLKASGATTMVSSSIRFCFTVWPQLLKKGRGGVRKREILCSPHGSAKFLETRSANCSK
jgi:hypothetical protein